MAWTSGWRSRWVLNLLDVKPTDHLLGIGFGPGTEIARVAKRADRGFVAGIDPSELMVRQAMRRNRSFLHTGRVRLQRASMGSIPYPDDSFDKAWGLNCIQFSTDLPHDLAEIRRVLRPAGMAAFGVQPLWKGATNETAARLGQDLEEAMTDAGFGPVSTEQRRSPPRTAVCVIGYKSALGTSLER
jgi:ubiquinone/menaquinone biosynthesis C-methylase UbiE